MPYIDFSGGSKQTPLEKNNNSDNNNFTCNNCIHRHIINKDLFYCTITGNVEFYNIKKPFDCIYKNIILKNRKIIIAVYRIKENGVFAWTGYTSIFSSSSEKTDDDVVKLFYEKALPDIHKREPKTKDLVIVPIIIGEAIDNHLFYGFNALMPPYILNDIISNINNNINNLGTITDE